eukprot:jgi/Orpsp1_1/1174937/evm.model.c7180000052014.1
MVKLLMDYADKNSIPLEMNQKGENGRYSLFTALGKPNEIEMIKVLIDYAINKNIILKLNENDIENYSNINDEAIKLLTKYEKKHLISIEYKPNGKFLDIKELPEYIEPKNNNNNNINNNNNNNQFQMPINQMYTPYYQMINPYIQQQGVPYNPYVFQQGIPYNPYMQGQGMQQGMSYIPYGQGMQQGMPQGMSQGMPMPMPTQMPMNSYMSPVMNQDNGQISSTTTNDSSSMSMDPQLSAKFGQSQGDQGNAPPPSNQMNQGNNNIKQL